jgi:hypothetical protein
VVSFVEITLEVREHTSNLVEIAQIGDGVGGDTSHGTLAAVAA